MGFNPTQARNMRAMAQASAARQAVQAQPQMAQRQFNAQPAGYQPPGFVANAPGRANMNTQPAAGYTANAPQGGYAAAAYQPPGLAYHPVQGLAGVQNGQILQPGNFGTQPQYVPTQTPPGQGVANPIQTPGGFTQLPMPMPVPMPQGPAMSGANNMDPNLMPPPMPMPQGPAMSGANNMDPSQMPQLGGGTGLISHPVLGLDGLPMMGGQGMSALGLGGGTGLISHPVQGLA